MRIHAIIDPEWKSGKLTRGQVYRRLAKALHLKSFHTSDISTAEQAFCVLKTANEIFVI
jgi:hypothetical protein